MPKFSAKIKKTLSEIPQSPGIYKMINNEGKVIYIGKAKDLSKRVKQYFKKDYEHSTRTKKLMENVADISYMAVDSELEAKILEHNLIKQFLPKYNVIMKDDKNFVYIKITKEDFPRIQIVRKIEKDNAKYIGPKSAAHKVKDTLQILRKIFPFRHCGLDIEFVGGEPGKYKVNVTHKVIKYPCLQHYIKRCVAPCIGCCNPEEYQKIIAGVENFLSGKGEKILDDLYEKMQIHAQKKEFEKAARLRDKIEKIKDILQRQKVSDPSSENSDIINYCITHDQAYFNLFQVRDGKLIGQENFILKAQDLRQNENDPEVLEAFLSQYYELATDIPREILIPHELENRVEIENFIEKESGKKSRIIIPKIGTKNKLLEMSLNNARIYADRNRPSWQEESEMNKDAAKDLGKLLKIKEPLKRIECYDISHLSGKDTVGSMIVFENGIPKKDHYRKFKLRTIDNTPDDYKSMEEVLTRRFSKITLEMHQKNYSFKKARKKDQIFVKKHLDADQMEKEKNLYVLEKSGSAGIVGLIGVKDISRNVSELTNLWLDEKERGNKLGYKLLKNAIKKAKSKRVYILCKQALKDYYLLFGFEEIKVLPEELKKHHEECKSNCEITLSLVYDKNKHKEDESFSQTPDLVIIDGGKGQLHSAGKIMQNLNLKIRYIALAKKQEEIFIPGKTESIILPKNNPALRLIQRARDEAHRFAISYNQKLRSKELFAN